MRAQKMWKLTQVRNDRTNDCPKNELVTEVTDMAEGEERFLGEKETTFFLRVTYGFDSKSVMHSAALKCDWLVSSHTRYQSRKQGKRVIVDLGRY